MTEECMNCGSRVTRYIVLAVSEFLDTADEDPEQTKFDDVLICDNCWNYVKGNSKILQNTLVK
ncbi:MAG TPA: hypothetical protein VH500_11735 [Nitrososphaeraceae archaeon]